MANPDLVCEDCGRECRTAAGLDSHRRSKHPPQVEGYVYSETAKAVRAANHITDADAGTVAVLLTLARTIDGIPERDPDAPFDNVTIPTYLKYSRELGLTVLSRLDFPKGEDDGESKLGKLRGSPQLVALRGGQAS